MLCVSECPSGCFIVVTRIFSSFFQAAKNANSAPNPVLGCKQARDTAVYEKTRCLGFRSEEHLIALTEYLDKPLSQPDRLAADAGTSFIVEMPKERIQSARRNIPRGREKELY